MTTLQSAFDTSRPTQEQTALISSLLTAMNTKDFAQKLINKGAAELYGSRLTGLCDVTSDVDICLVWKNFSQKSGPEADTMAKKVLERLRHLLIHLDGMTGVRVVPARTPVIHCVYQKVLTCDVTVQPYCVNQLANSATISRIAAALPCLGPLVHAFKTWAIRREVYGSPQGYLSTFMITTMIVHALQMHSPPYVEPQCPEPILNSSYQPPSPLEDLTWYVLRFFAMYDYAGGVISLHGRRTREDYRVHVQTTGGLAPPPTAMVVEDLANCENSARRVGPDQFEKIHRELCQCAARVQLVVDSPSKSSADFYEAFMGPVSTACPPGEERAEKKRTRKE